jgi:broad specificity phosphatase PhoE
MTKIHLVRHGQASLGAADYDQLSAIGVQQATLLGRWLGASDVKLARAVSGRPQRHVQTAETVLAAMRVFTPSKCQLVTEAAFDEFDPRAVLVAYDPIFDRLKPGVFGAIGNMTDEDFRAHFARAFNRWVSGCYDNEYPLSWAQFRGRCVNAVEGMANRSAPDGNAIVFTSAGPIAAICQHYLGVPDTRVDELRGQLLNTSLTCLTESGGSLTLTKFNAIPHLEGSSDRNVVTSL